jgi:hypothetical protein
MLSGCFVVNVSRNPIKAELKRTTKLKPLVLLIALQLGGGVRWLSSSGSLSPLAARTGRKVRAALA